MTVFKFDSPVDRDQRSVDTVSKTLREAFGENYSLWINQGAWLTATGKQNGFSELPLQVDAVELSALLDAVASATEPRVATANNRQILAIPLPGDTVQVAVVDSAAPPALLLKFGQFFLNDLARRRELDKLKEENSSLVLQVAQDFDELTFLGSMVDHLDLNGISSTLDESVLETLIRTTRAECLVLLPRRNTANPTSDNVDKQSAMLRAGRPLLNEKQCWLLVDKFGEEARTGPIVRNYFQRSSDGRIFPGLEELVLVSLSNQGEGFGWLLALNRDQGAGFDYAGHAKTGRYEFGTGEASLLATAASVFGTQASNLELLGEKEQLLLSVVRALVSAIEAKDPYTRGHSERVATIARRVSEELGLEPSFCEKIYLTGLLHDIGKIGIQDAILKKEEKLDDREFREIKTHPDLGWAILQGLNQLAYVLPGVVHHHESFDGSGYPDRLAGLQIPLDARIIAVVDAFDAMTSDRPYRQGMPIEKVEDILHKGAGKQWDPAVLDVFFSVFDDIVAIQKSYQPCEVPDRKPIASVNFTAAENTDLAAHV